MSLDVVVLVAVVLELVAVAVGYALAEWRSRRWWRRALVLLLPAPCSTQVPTRIEPGGLVDIG